MRFVFVLIFAIICSFLYSLNALSAPLSGSVYKEGYLNENSSRVIDNVSGNPVSNAEVSIPAKGVSSVTDQNGRFDLDMKGKAPFILSVKANGYKPFSVTINENSQKPFILGITKQSANDIVVDTSLHHLGDNSFSPNSANAYDFQTNSTGSSFTKRFYIKPTGKKSRPSLIIGSIIGVDTDVARKLRQNNIVIASSSPTKIYLNSQKIGEIRINGDQQEIPFPASLLRPDGSNEITVETGQNLYQTKYVDYDDIEFMNLIIEMK